MQSHLGAVVTGVFALVGVGLGAALTLVRDYLRERKGTQRELREVLALLYVFYADVFLQIFNLRQVGQLLKDDLETAENIDAHRLWVLEELSEKFARVREGMDAALVTMSAVDPLISGRFYLTQEGFTLSFDEGASDSIEEARERTKALAYDLEGTLERIRETAEDICRPAGVAVEKVRDSFFSRENVRRIHGQTLDRLYGPVCTDLSTTEPD